MLELVRFFKALGDETRLALISYFLGHEQVIADFLPEDEKEHAAMTRHLEILCEAKIIKRERNGSDTLYSIASGHMRERLGELGILSTQDLMLSTDEEADIKEVVRERYARIAEEVADETVEADHVEASQQMGYSEEDISVAPDANLGLGCGNPAGLGSIVEGETVLDMGCGAGIDTFIAAKRVGESGRVIGIDMTEDMILLARENAETYDFENVEFRWGDIENMPVETGSIDVVLSNCVINLAPDKPSAFREAYRVLKPQGRVYISDIILTGELSEEQKADEDIISGCVAGAVSKDEYLQMMEDAGFSIQEISENEEIGNEFYRGLPVASLHIRAVKRVA